MISIYLNFWDKLVLYNKGSWPIFFSLCLFIGPAFYFAGGGSKAFLGLQFQMQQVDRVQGFVTDIIITNSTNNEEVIYQYDYSFPVGLETFYGRSYSHKFDLEIDQPVPIEYLSKSPDVSRIKGANITLAGSFSYIGAILFLIALVVMAFRIRWLKQMQGAFYDGSVTRAEFRSKTNTGAHVNDRRLFKLTYQYFVDRDSFKITHLTTKPEGLERAINVLYSNQAPSYGILFPDLPYRLYAKVKDALQEKED